MTRYVAIDLETTGLDPGTCQILELACVVETDWVTPVAKLPSLRLLVGHPVIRGEAEALAMHGRLLAELAKPRSERDGLTASGDEVVPLLAAFCREHFGAESVTLAGKNVGTFDLRFLERLSGWGTAFRVRHRVIDPGVLWMNPGADAVVPDTAKCLRRAGLVNDRPHDALSDCRAVVELVRHGFASRASAAGGHPREDAA